MKSSPIFFLTALAAIAIAPCLGQKFSFGSCPTVTSSGITLARLAANGPWRVYGRTPSVHRHFLRCAMYTFTVVTTDILYRYVVNAVNKVTGTPVVRAGTAIIGANLTPAATLPATGYIGFVEDNGYITKTVRYYVIYADAVAMTYFVLYSCENVAFGKIESAMLLANSALTGADVASYSTLALATVGASTKLLQRVYDADC